jgi:predicted N-acetyltransferase YhbS
MIEYRAARPDEREDIIDLANLAFRFDLESLIPKVYGESLDPSPFHKVAVDERGRLRAQVAVLPETMTVCGTPLSIGYLGIVSVHPRDRGKGHMKALMDMWLKETRETCDMIALFGQRQRYEYFGFTQGGVRLKYTVGIANVRHALRAETVKGLEFRPLFEVEGAAIFAQSINTARMAYIHRDTRLMPAILNGMNQHSVGVLEEGKLIGYLTTNKTGDEISELALGNADDAKRVIKAYIEDIRADRILIYAPKYEILLNSGISSFAEDCTVEASDMFNIIDYANVLKAFLTLKHMTTGLIPGDFSAVLDGQPVTARVSDEGVTVERSAKPGAVVMGKQQAQTLLISQYGRYLSAITPVGWFPLPIFWYFADRF